MRTWPTALKSMLAGRQLTTCFLIELVSRNSQTIRICDYSQDIVIDGQAFVHDPGFHVTNVKLSAGGSPPSVDMQLPITDDGPIFAADIRRGVWRGAAFRLWLCNYATATTAADLGPLLDGFVGNVGFTDDLITSIEALSRGDATADIVLPRIQPKCRHVFGDTYCGFNIANVTLAGTVNSVTNNGKFSITISNPNAFDFNDGAIKMTSGANNGFSLDVRKWTSGSALVETWDPFPLNVVSGDTFSIHAGCAKSRTACAAYNNINHYGGYDHIPGQLYGGL